jgi:hypothetical protein
MVGSLQGVMPRTVVLAFLAAAVALAAVLPTESGDVFYFDSGGQAGAVNAFGKTLWSVPGQLIASDAMGSCLAVASALYNGTAFLGTAVTLYTPDGRPLWSAVVGVNATALATNCVETAVGGIDGSLYVLKDGKVASRQKYNSPVFALAYMVNGTLLVGTGDPASGFTAYVDRCGNSITAVRTDAPYLIVNSTKFVVKYRGGLAPMLRPPAAASQDCRTFIYAVYDTLYNNTSPLVKLPPARDCSGGLRRQEDDSYRHRGEAVHNPRREDRRGARRAGDALHSPLMGLADAGLHIRRGHGRQEVQARQHNRHGVPLPVRVRASGFTYSLPAVAYVPADTSALQPSPAQNGAVLPASNSTPPLPKTIVQHRTLYAVRPGPPAQGAQADLRPSRALRPVRA